MNSFEVIDLGKIKIDNRQISWRPQDDITAFELAQCVPLFFARHHPLQMFDSLPPDCKRHWLVSE